MRGTRVPPARRRSSSGAARRSRGAGSPPKVPAAMPIPAAPRRPEARPTGPTTASHANTPPARDCPRGSLHQRRLAKHAPPGPRSTPHRCRCLQLRTCPANRRRMNLAASAHPLSPQGCPISQTSPANWTSHRRTEHSRRAPSGKRSWREPQRRLFSRRQLQRWQRPISVAAPRQNQQRHHRAKGNTKADSYRLRVRVRSTSGAERSRSAAKPWAALRLQCQGRRARSCAAQRQGKQPSLPETDQN
mmetsp:Transcript_20558/g.52444  ORF Transcript_20558/g.52444 Transcript_20558/m.52444 type:complete len:246 (-) Transcript_20558:33-770(-)